MHPKLKTIIADACARRVILGLQRWSGADLRGRARDYGAGYARQRSAARRALEAAGGTVVAHGPHGRPVTGAQIDGHVYTVAH